MSDREVVGPSDTERQITHKNRRVPHSGSTLWKGDSVFHSLGVFFVWKCRRCAYELGKLDVLAFWGAAETVVLVWRSHRPRDPSLVGIGRDVIFFRSDLRTR